MIFKLKSKEHFKIQLMITKIESHLWMPFLMNKFRFLKRLFKKFKIWQLITLTKKNQNLLNW